jgi:hypothetical protein
MQKIHISDIGNQVIDIEDSLDKLETQEHVRNYMKHLTSDVVNTPNEK